jgi:hypothetical protein
MSNLNIMVVNTYQPLNSLIYRLLSPIDSAPNFRILSFINSILNLKMSSSKSSGNGASNAARKQTNEPVISDAGNDLIAALAAYDNANPESASANKGYWDAMAKKPQSATQAASATFVQSGGNKAQSTLAAMMFSQQITGNCGRIGCKDSEGLFGSKCSCGAYRTNE